MNKNDLIAAVAASTNLSKTDAANAVDSILTVITKSLKKKEKVLLVGFGTFQVSQAQGRRGPQSADRREDQDPGRQRAALQGQQGPQGRGQLSDSGLCSC